MNKKNIILVSSGVLLLFLLAIAGFFVFRAKANPPSSPNNNPAPEATSALQPKLASFKGVLSNLPAVNADDQNLPEKNPFKENVPAAASPTDNKKPGTTGFSFAIIGDTQAFEYSPPSGNLKKAVGSIAKQNVDQVFVVGDLVYRCSIASLCQKSYENWKNIMSPLMSKTYEIQGNHDRSGDTMSDGVWQKEFSDLPANGPPGFADLVYSFDFKNSHFIVLDTEKPRGNEVGSEQLTWLKNDLATHRKEHTFVFYHEPAFATGQKKRHGLDANPEQRDKLWNILDSNQVTAVFNGHEHIFTRKKIGSIYQFVVGDTDAPFDATPKRGLYDYAYKGNFYAIATVTGAKINISLYSVGGNLINSFDFS